MKSPRTQTGADDASEVRVKKEHAKTEHHKQVERVAATRAALLEAAGRIFARDGFEASRIEDIALEAGRSRGAFYANFENKADLFIALREQNTRRRAREIRKAIEHLEDEADRDKAIKAYMLHEILDERILLLQLEFKLFAIRRPEILREMAEKHLATSSAINREELSEFCSPALMSTATLRRKTLAMEAVLEGLAVNFMFHPGVLGRKQIIALLPRLLDQIFDMTSNADLDEMDEAITKQLKKLSRALHTAPALLAASRVKPDGRKNKNLKAAS